VAQFSFELPDELIPALIAEYWIVSNAGATQAENPEDYFRESIVETVRQRAKIYKVGPYFEGIIQPKFLIDGMPNPEYNGSDNIILPENFTSEELNPLTDEPDSTSINN
jgi:hypothetical protein